MKFWYQQKSTWASILLYPLSKVYQCIVILRRCLYQINILKRYAVPVPVIVVGNLVVGGAGKTPLVIALVKHFQSQGKRIGVISRGYKSTTTHFPHHVDLTQAATVAGEEAFLIAKQTQAPVVIDPNRVRAAQSLLQHHPACDWIISDDGLQHYALKRDLEIIVVDTSRLFGNQLCLPAGPLRDPLNRLTGQEIIVANQREPQRKWPNRLQVAPYDMFLQPHYFSQIQYPDRRLLPSQFLPQKRLIAVAGIGNPRAFFNTLKGLSLEFEPVVFPDHHHFTVDDFKPYRDAVIIMTEKDAVKCRTFATKHYWFLSITAQLSTRFYEKVEKCLSC